MGYVGGTVIPTELRADVDQIRKYRERHKIKPQAVFGETYLVCRHDNVRIIPRRGQAWRHDPDEVRDLSRRTAQYQP